MTDARFGAALNLIKEKVTLSRIVSQDVVLHKKGREFVGHCPFHNEKTGSFFVNDDKGTFYCFGCGASGDIFEYLMKKRGVQFMQAVETLAEIAGIKLPEKVTNENNSIANQQKVLQKALEFFKSNFELNPEAVNYCNKRGITGDLRAKFSIGYAPKNGDLLLNYLKKSGFSIEDILNSGVFVKKDERIIARFRDRVIFPVLNKKGWPIAFGGRGIRKDAIPKYINSPETELFQKRETLYGYNLALKSITKDNPFVLVEGYMDVVMMHKFGFNTAIASMGTAFSLQHLAKIWKYSNNPILCLDGDSAGHNAMVKISFMAMPYLQPGKSLRFCKIPGDDDPDSFLKSHSKSEMIKLLQESSYLIDFFWNHFASEYESLKNKTPENIAEWKKEIYNHIEEIQNQDIKTLYKKDIKDRIYNLLNKARFNKDPNAAMKPFEFRVDKNEKMLLREAALLYIIITRPSVISSIIEELAAVEFSNKEFETLREYIIENVDSLEDGKFDMQIDVLKKMVSSYCNCEGMTDDEVINFWHSIFEFGISKERIADDLKAAKDECNASLNTSTWDRLKALKLDLLNMKKE